MIARTLLAASLLALVWACGGSGGGAPGHNAPAGSTPVTMTEFKFSPNSLTEQHGKVVFFLVNSGSTTHDMVISDASGKIVAKSDLVQPGDSQAFTIGDLAPGHYSVYCDLPGHKESGMTATLDVS